MRKGEILNIPVWSIHHDPEYFSEPLKFDPERFSDENKHLINPMAYMPFGLGPRNCIGELYKFFNDKLHFSGNILCYNIALISISPISLKIIS